MGMTTIDPDRMIVWVEKSNIRDAAVKYENGSSLKYRHYFEPDLN